MNISFQHLPKEKNHFLAFIEGFEIEAMKVLARVALIYLLKTLL